MSASGTTAAAPPAPPAVAPSRRGRRGLRPHLASVRGRARADSAILLLALATVAVTATLSATVPRTSRQAADVAVRQAVRTAGPDAALFATSQFSDDSSDVGRVRDPASASTIDDTVEETRRQLSPALAAVLRNPVATVTSVDLGLLDHGARRTLRLAYAAGQGGTPAVTWVQGRAPRAAFPAKDPAVTMLFNSPPWPVEIGLAEDTATALRVAPGDRLQTLDPHNLPVELRVTGLYRPVDAGDAAWVQVPQLVAPRVTTSALGTALYADAYLSRDSLPDARLAIDPSEVFVGVAWTPDPAQVTATSADPLAAAVVALQAATGAASDRTAPSWQSNLDSVLRDASLRIRAAAALDAVLVAGLVLAAGLTLALAAVVLMRRRAGNLARSRLLGASLPGIAIELLVESLVVGAVGAGLALAAAGLAGGGSLARVLPIAVIAVLAGPVAGVRVAAESTGGRAAPANRSARASAAQLRRARVLATEAGVVLVGVAAFVALRQRSGVVAGGTGTDVLAAAAPGLCVLAAAVVVRRLVPLALRVGLRRAVRSRRAVPLFAAARAAESGGRVVPFLALTVGTALAGVAAVLAATSGGLTPLAKASAPLAQALQRFAGLATLVFAGLAVLAVALGAASSTRDRGETIARLRTLGLTPGEARRVIAGELAGPAVAASVGGLLIGVWVAGLCVHALGLRLLSGQPADPAVVVPWWAAGCAVAVLVTLVVVVVVESSLARRERLGQVLRAGG